MSKIYIVIEGGCLRYVSTNSQTIIDNTAVVLIDLDGVSDLGKEDREASEAAFSVAESLNRIW